MNDAPIAAPRTSESLSYPVLPCSSELEDAKSTEVDQNSLSDEKHETSNASPGKPTQAEVDSTGNHRPTEFTSTADEDITQQCDQQSLAMDRITYPSLPDDTGCEIATKSTRNSAETKSNTVIVLSLSPQDTSGHLELDDDQDWSGGSFTEASLQLNMQGDIKTQDSTGFSNDNSALEGMAAEDANANSEEESHTTAPLSAQDNLDDITSGLNLEPTFISSKEPTSRKLRSPSPPLSMETGPEDTTMTFAFDDDTALLKNFLSRAAASKANKAENIARRESLQNRRDSDVVRHALASPRKVLEDKDPNSPSKHGNEATLDLSQTPTLGMEPPAPPSPSRVQGEVETTVDVDSSKAERSSRRSSRTKKSRLPAPSSIPTGPPKISVKRDGGDPVILKKSDAQELGLLTRTNTRRNKQGAVAVNVRLLKLSNDPRTAEESTVDASDSVVQAPGKKYVRWDSQLTYFQENSEAIANALADAESLATPDELSSAPPSALPTKLKTPKVPRDKNTTPKVRKVKNLGSANGTPGKGLLIPASLLPDSMLEDRDEPKERRLPKLKSSRLKMVAVGGSSTTSAPAPVESQLPALEIAPVGIEPTKATTKEHRSRLATPRKVKLPQVSSSTLGGGKENQGKGSGPATPKNGIPAPCVVVPSTSEVPSIGTGLPRRRGRKL